MEQLNTTPNFLTKDQVDFYNNNGYLAPVPAVGGTIAQDTLSKIELFEEKYGDFPQKDLDTLRRQLQHYKNGVLIHAKF